MKSSIHPTWYPEAAVTCSCGNSFTIGSTKESLQVDICDKCHPFFTGEVKFVDRQGRVDKFRKQQELAAQKQQTKKSGKKTAKETESKSYRELLQDQQAALRASTKSAASAAETA